MADLVERVVWADQRPKGDDVEQAARDSLIRYTIHHGLRIVGPVRVMYGERWRSVPVQAAWPEMWPRGLVPTGVRGARAWAHVVPGRDDHAG